MTSQLVSSPRSANQAETNGLPVGKPGARLVSSNQFPQPFLTALSHSWRLLCSISSRKQLVEMQPQDSKLGPMPFPPVGVYVHLGAFQVQKLLHRR
jgi:hypothetical protein